MTDPARPFGIGCMYLDTKDTSNLSDWKKLVTSTLGAIPSISELEISARSDTFRNQEYIFPYFGRIDFQVTIPARLQEELDPLRRKFDAQGEKFSVSIRYHYSAPVTFIISNDASEPDDGSEGVVLVREFLERELKARPGPARLQTLGPSPFHVDASIVPADQTEPFVLQRTRMMGYDRFAFTYSQDSFSSMAEAFDELFDTLIEELSLYYALVRRRDKRLEFAVNIANETEALIEMYQANALGIRLKRFFSSGSMMRRLTLRAITADYESQRDGRQDRNDLDELYSRNSFPCFKDYLDDKASDTYDADLSNARDITALLDQTRNQQVQVTSLFLSALAGGLAGALISVLVH
jgi:hypothetical protein